MVKVLLFCFINCLFIYGSFAQSQCMVYEGVGNDDNIFKDLYALKSLQGTNDGYMVDLHVSIDMGSEARIALTTEPHSTNPTYSGDYVLEIGGLDNDNIFLYKAGVVVLNVDLPGTLSSIQIQSFWIHMTEGGFLAVGKEGESEPLATYQDQNPLAIKYFGFGSYYANDYRFYYNCSSNKNLPAHPTTELPQCSRYNVYDWKANETKYSLEYLNGANSSYLVDFHFSVRATRGAYVEFLTADESGIYRIGFGAYRFNQLCIILKNGQEIFSTDCANVLSGSDIRSFFIRITTDGNIYLGREQDNNYFTYFYDNDVLPVTHFRFSTTYSIQSSYFYNCTTPI